MPVHTAIQRVFRAINVPGVAGRVTRCLARSRRRGSGRCGARRRRTTARGYAHRAPDRRRARSSRRSRCSPRHRGPGARCRPPREVVVVPRPVEPQLVDVVVEPPVALCSVLSTLQCSRRVAAASGALPAARSGRCGARPVEPQLVHVAVGCRVDRRVGSGRRPRCSRQARSRPAAPTGGVRSGRCGARRR